MEGGMPPALPGQAQVLVGRPPRKLGPRWADPAAGLGLAYPARPLPSPGDCRVLGDFSKHA